jgi:NAD(P)-dependent dehydrogenase (short-subunit alcohol dehydrogenase family)
MPALAVPRGTAIVTGAGRGIGRAIALALAGEGFDVVMASVETEPDALPASPSSAGQLAYVEFDLADLRHHAALVDEAVGRFGPITCLVNNAGVTSLARGDLLELTPASFDRVIAVNLRGTFFLTQAVARHMLGEPASADRYRSIVTISSINADVVGENRADYCMSKAALAMLNKLYAARLAEAAIGVFEIRPGIIATAMTAPATAKYDPYISSGGVPMRRWGAPQDIARTVATLARGDIPFTTGIHIDVGGGMQLHRV